MTKPGVQTTEFWLTLLSNAAAVVGALKGVIPPETAAIIMAVINSVYSTLRTLAKQEPKAKPASG